MTYENYPYIYEQYDKTNLSDLLRGIAKIKKEYLLKPLEAIKSDLMDLQTAKGNALDEWGRLLNFSRYIPNLTIDEYNELIVDFTPDDELIFYNNDDLNTFAFYDSTFDDLTFAVGNENNNYSALGDEAYRQILQFIYQSQNVYINTENLKILLDGFFKLDVAIKESQDKIMTFEVYYFLENLPVWQKMIFTKFDLIPRPAGVKLEFKQGSYRFFGFETDDMDYNIKSLGNFNNSIFKGI